MKRKKPIEYDNVFSCFPIFFWRTCHVCKMDFKLEKGWEVLKSRGTISMSRWVYVCRECAPTKKIAYEKAHEWPPKPDMPPVKPPKKE